MTPPLVLRKIFETRTKKSHVVYQSTHIATGAKVAQLESYNKASFSYILIV